MEENPLLAEARIFLRKTRRIIMKKKFLALLTTCALAVTALTGCGKNNSTDPYTGTLVLATWDNNLYNFIEEYEIISKIYGNFVKNKRFSSCRSLNIPILENICTTSLRDVVL